jgi:hypothetical protein
VFFEDDKSLLLNSPTVFHVIENHTTANENSAA